MLQFSEYVYYKYYVQYLEGTLSREGYLFLDNDE